MNVVSTAPQVHERADSASRGCFCYNAYMTKGTIKPLRDLLLIQLDEVERQTDSGIMLMYGWERTQNTATILAVGDKVTRTKVGDRVIVNPYAILDATHEGGLLQFMREGDVLAYV